jgi:hypothetical protein
MQQLIKFAEVNIRGAMLDHDNTRGLAALIELRRIYVALDMVWPEDFFAAEIKAMDAGLDRLHHAMRTSLLRDYVRCQDPSEVLAIGETLERCIAADSSWDWQSEFDKALAEPQMAS